MEGIGVIIISSDYRMAPKQIPVARKFILALNLKVDLGKSDGALLTADIALALQICVERDMTYSPIIHFIAVLTKFSKISFIRRRPAL